MITRVVPGNSIRDIEGEWEYECVSEGIEHPDNVQSLVTPMVEGGNAHGGSCKIKISNGFYTTRVSVRGTRTWYGSKKGQTINKTLLEKPVEWTSLSGSFISNSEIMYKYTVNNEAIHGVTFLKFTYDKNTKTFKGIGDFYYFPNRNNHLSDTKGNLNYEQLRALKIVRNFGEVYGQITLTSRKNKP
jgi:hypothetical protein